MSAEDIILAITKYCDNDTSRELNIDTLSYCLEFEDPTNEDELLEALKVYDV